MRTTRGGTPMSAGSSLPTPYAFSPQPIRMSLVEFQLLQQQHIRSIEEALEEALEACRQKHTPGDAALTHLLVFSLNCTTAFASAGQ